MSPEARTAMEGLVAELTETLSTFARSWRGGEGERAGNIALAALAAISGCLLSAIPDGRLQRRHLDAFSAALAEELGEEAGEVKRATKGMHLSAAAMSGCLHCAVNVVLRDWALRQGKTDEDGDRYTDVGEIARALGQCGADWACGLNAAGRTAYREQLIATFDSMLTRELSKGALSPGRLQ